MTSSKLGKNSNSWVVCGCTGNDVGKSDKLIQIKQGENYMRQMANILTGRGFSTQKMVLALVSLFLLVSASQLHAAEVDPFKTLLGSWKGSGTFSLQDGTRERISCNGYYTGGGSQLGLAILCSSSNNKIHMRGKISHSAGRLSGSWEERTYNAEGSLSGKATSGRLTMTISGNVTGSMTVSYSKTRQSVSIRTIGTALKSVNINLAR